MPDLDRVERSISRFWRAPYRLLKGGHDPQMIADELSKCTAAELRKQGGIPGFEPFLRACVAPEPKPESMRTIADVSRSLQQQFGQGRNIKLLSRAMQQTREKIAAGRVLPGPNQLAEEFLRRLVRHHFFSKINILLVAGENRFNDVTQAREFERLIWQALDPQIEKLARRVVADPSASKLRAPRSVRHRVSTVELLDTPI